MDPPVAPAIVVRGLASFREEGGISAITNHMLCALVASALFRAGGDLAQCAHKCLTGFGGTLSAGGEPVPARDGCEDLNPQSAVFSLIPREFTNGRGGIPPWPAAPTGG